MKRSSTILENDCVKSIAIGGFDGIHKAHQKLISHLDEYSLLIVIDKKNASLTPSYHRCKYLKQECVFLDFEQICDLTAQRFISFLQISFKNLKKIVVGYDFRFGKDAQGDVKLLKELFDGEVVVVDEVFEGKISIHSRVIRSFLKDGKVKEANKLLGRKYEIEGDVITGQGIGQKELVATLNLEVCDFLIPKEGVYATYTKLGDKLYPSASFVGKRLSTDDSFSIETHIIDDVIKNSHSKVTIIFIGFVRENRKFENLTFLKEQIKKDIVQIKTMLSL